MSQRRTLILVAAIIIGALASFLVWNYVGGIQDQAYSDAERVKVYLVKKPITRGMSGNEARAYIAEEDIPRKFRPANAITSLDDITDQVAGADLVPNQVVVQDMFVAATDPSARRSFSENLAEIRAEDQVTYTINVDQVKGVAGLIVPGDYVNILVLELAEVINGGGAEDGGDGADPAAPAGTINDTQARYLYQKVQVLAVDYLTVGQSAPGGAAASTGNGEDIAAANAEIQSGMITFIVPAKAAQILASIPPENIYLSLVSADYEPKPQSEIDIATLPAEDSERLTPYGPEGARTSD